jgi:transposase-like protein
MLSHHFWCLQAHGSGALPNHPIVVDAAVDAGPSQPQVWMASHPPRQQAIQRCLEQGDAPARVAAELGVAASTLRGWLRQARQERELAAVRQERDALHQRQAQLVSELHQAAAALAELKGLLDRADPGGGRAAG